MGRHFEVRKAAMAKTNASKSKLYAKFGKEVLIAAKSGVPDPSMNLTLKRAIDKAKAAQVPGDVIKRAIEKASSGADESFVEVVYEAFGPGASTMIVECLTDNVNRAVTEVRTAFNRCGFKMGVAGCVSHAYTTCSVVSVSGTNEDEVLNTLIEKEIDITNIETEEDLVVVYGDPALLYEIKEAVETIENAKVESFEKTRIPDEYIELTDEEDIVKFDRLLTLLEDIDDVQEFYHNVDR